MRARSSLRCDEAEIPADAIRVDRATLRKSERRDDGSVVYEAVLSRVDARLVYSWGQEVATEEALSDPAYLSGLEGLAVVALHPGAQRVDITDPSTYDEVGTVLSARWDAAEKLVVIRLVVRRTDAIQAIKGGQTGVSEGYAVPHLDATTQPARQLKRVPNHVALTLSGQPRMPGAHIRADQESSMTLETFTALCSGYSLRTDSAAHLREDLDALRQASAAAKAETATEKTRADAAEALVAKLQPAIESLGLDVRADSLDIEGALTARVAEVVELQQRADALGLEIPADAKTPGAIRKALALGLKAPADRCDSDDFCAGVIAAAQPVTAAARMAASAIRADAAPDFTRF